MKKTPQNIFSCQITYIVKNGIFDLIFLGAKTIGAVQRGLTVSHAGIAKSPMVALRKNNINLPEEVESARSIELNIGKKVNKLC